jgi:hypothetical protein
MTTETVGGEFRVVAETTTGGEALVCLAETRRQAAAKARLFARHDRLPDGAEWLRLDWWNGVRWVAVRTGRKELPVPRVVRPRVAAR